MKPLAGRRVSENVLDLRMDKSRKSQDLIDTLNQIDTIANKPFSHVKTKSNPFRQSLDSYVGRTLRKGGGAGGGR